MEVTNYDELLDCYVVVVAPKLTSFNCLTDSSIGICLLSSTALMDASLRFCYPGDHQNLIVYQRLLRLLRKIGDSKRLTLSTQTLEASRRFFEHAPVLQKLTYLDISGFLSATTIEAILELMQKTPNLECLFVYLDVMLYDDWDDWWSAPPALRCLMNKFKNLKVKCLDASKSKIHLIKFFLENAPNLEKVEVYAYYPDEEKLGRFRNELVALPRSSEKCVFAFEVIDFFPDDDDDE